MKTVPVASFIILALIWLGSTQPVRADRVADGVPGDVYQRAFRHPRSGTTACWKWRGYSRFRRFGAFAASICRRSCRISARAARWGLACAGKRAWRRRSSACPCPPSASGLQQAKVYLDTPELFAWTLVIVLMSVGFEKLFMAALGALEKEADAAVRLRFISCAKLSTTRLFCAIFPARWRMAA